MSQRPGSLTIAGLGIDSQNHTTLETVRYIRSADKIHYLVNDRTVVDFIQHTRYENKDRDPAQDAQNLFDLSRHYYSDRFRYETYLLMANEMVVAVRGGHNVLGLFYGHPGFFVSPSSQAIGTLRREGYAARMLPGISALDYLIADLEIEPARYGLMVHEANDLLVRNRSINPWAHNVILQVGGVGDMTAGISNSKFGRLVDQLEHTFGRDHKLVYYVGKITPFSWPETPPEPETLPEPATIPEPDGTTPPGVRCTVEQLRGLASKISMDTTLYIPPCYIPSVHRAAVREMGFDRDLRSVTMMNRVPEWVDTRWVLPPFDGDFTAESERQDWQIAESNAEASELPSTLSTIGVAI